MNGINEFRVDNGVFVSGKQLSKISTGKPGTYVLNSSSLNIPQGRFAVSLSNHVAKIYDFSGKLLDEYVHDKDITDVKYYHSDPLCLFTSSLDGKIAVWDSRCQGPVQTFKDDTEDVLKPLLCFDYNVDEYLLCAGTELFREDAFLLFWDRRTSEILGGYWNSHTNDITQVSFHPSVGSLLASSGADGLINVFDLYKTTEIDALSYTFNAESAVNKFCWKNKDFIDCITSIEEYQIWNVADAKPTFSVTREKMSTKQIQVDYFIDDLKINSCFLASGTNEGTVYLWNSLENQLQPHGYLLSGGHNDIVRTICYDTQEEILLTGGEDACVCLWKIT